ncbi:MAG: DHA2 family efflux MFS transporter permease subunit [Candidatus Tectomicrobia bacterium]|nr:DHA2 family efflux MFS transporter permease subunit [Candidatus Tectomicrobia bacterium]
MEETKFSQVSPSETEVNSFADHPSYKWWVTWTIMVGCFLFALDTTIVNIAIPQIMVGIGADLNQIQWVLIIYMIGMAIVMPASGWLSDLIGHKWLYIGSLTLFTLSSVLCGMAWSPASLIFFRCLQGLGAGAIAPTSMAVIFHVFPPEQRGLGMGIYSLGWTFGPILGPTLGGYLTDTISWRAIFYINLPLGIVGVAMALTIMAADLSHRRPRRLDFFGLVTMTTGIVTLLVALSEGNREGWSSQYIVWLFIIASVSLGLFVLIELGVHDPLINLRLYRNITYCMASFAGVLLGFGMFGFHLLLPLFLQDFLDYTAMQAALLMLPGVILSGILSPLSGKWCDKYNPRLFLALGFLITAVSTYWFAWMGMQTEERTLVWALLLRGGLALVFAPIAMLALRTLAREEISAASGLLNITRQMAGMGGIALAGVLLERWHYMHHLTGAAHLDAATDAVRQVQGQLAWLLQAGGDAGEIMQTKVQAMLSNYLNQESLNVAFQDCFIVFTVVFVTAALASLCIPGGEPEKS